MIPWASKLSRLRGLVVGALGFTSSYGIEVADSESKSSRPERCALLWLMGPSCDTDRMGVGNADAMKGLKASNFKAAILRQSEQSSLPWKMYFFRTTCFLVKWRSRFVRSSRNAHPAFQWLKTLEKTEKAFKSIPKLN